MGTFDEEWISKYYTVQKVSNVYTPISFYSNADTVYLTAPSLNAEKTQFTGGTTLAQWYSTVNTILGSGSGSLDTRYVPLGRTIAGVDLKDNVTADEMRTALNVANGANNYVHPSYTPTAASYTAAGHSVTVRDLAITNGHISAVGADKTLNNIVTGPGTLDADHIVLGNGTDTVKNSSYTISNSLSDSSTVIPTGHAVSAAIVAAKAAGVEYKGTLTAWPTSTDGLSKGDFYKFTTPSTGSLPSGVHAGDLAIFNGGTSTTISENFDLVHSELDTDTDTYYTGSFNDSTRNLTLTRQGSKKGNDIVVNIPNHNDNTTYTLTQDKTDGHKFTLTGTNGYTSTITIPDNNTTYGLAGKSNNGLMSSADFNKLAGIANGATANTGTVTSVSVKMNGSSKGTVTTSGTIDLGSVTTPVTPKDFTGSNADVSGAYSAVQVNASGSVTKVGQFLVSATSTSDTSLNNLAIGGFALIG